MSSVGTSSPQNDGGESGKADIGDVIGQEETETAMKLSRSSEQLI